jgi:hypothetical protein
LACVCATAGWVHSASSDRHSTIENSGRILVPKDAIGNRTAIDKNRHAKPHHWRGRMCMAPAASPEISPNYAHRGSESAKVVL